MAIGPAQRDRVVRCHLVQEFLGGPLLVHEHLVLPMPASNQHPGFDLGDPFANPLGNDVLVGDVPKLDVLGIQRPVVSVGIVESGDHESSAGIDDLGVLTDVVLDGVVGGHGDDLLANDGDGFGPRVVMVDGDDVGVHHHKVCRRARVSGLAAGECGKEGGKCESGDPLEHVLSPSLVGTPRRGSRALLEDRSI